MKPACQTCAGTGHVLCLNSAITTDGFRRERCGICAGSGRSRYPATPEYDRFQKRARILLIKWGGLKPKASSAPEIGAGT